MKLISDGNGLYGATSTASIYFSSDNGLNWESLPLHPDIFPYGVDLFDKVDDYLFFSQNIGGSTYNYRTYYNGENWEDWEILPYDESIIYEFVHYDNTIYALLNQGISVSSDYGTSWELIDTPSITGYIHLQYVDDQYLYINHGCILYRYNIETFEWVDITGILDDIGPPEPYSCTSIHQIEKFNDKLLISMYWYGGVGTLFYSQNNGDSWEIINSFPSLSSSGYGTNNVPAVATKNGILYAGTATSEDGIYYTQNLIDWTEYSAGLSNYNLSVSALAATEENIYKLGGSVNLFQNELIGVSGDIYGCTDTEACNYNPEATVEDGSCTGPYLCDDGVTFECNLEECPDENESTFGYLREIEVSDCQDACSQYYIEMEIDGGFGSIPVIAQNSNINMELYADRFVEIDLGQEFTCVECSAFEINQIDISDECWFPVDCFENPCEVAEECQFNIPVGCVPNYCDGCYADFYDLEGNLVDCNSSSNECIDLSGLDFGPCAMVLGIGYVNGECNYVSGCGWILNGIDYSDAFFDSMDECSSACFSNSFTLGDINNDSMINVQDIVLLVNFVLQTDLPTDTEFMAADYNEDGILNILDVVSIVDLILNPQTSIQINSGTSYGECWGYCVFELQIDNSNALFTASGWGWYEFPDLLLEDNLSQEMWQQIIELIDFEYFQSLDDVYGCPDCADGGAEFIEIIYDGVAKQVTFDAYTEIDGIQELTILLRDLRDEYWNQINENQECSIMPEVGPCDGICPTYYFNQNTNQCEEFITGCCGIEAFDSMQNCIDTCE